MPSNTITRAPGSGRCIEQSLVAHDATDPDQLRIHHEMVATVLSLDRRGYPKPLQRQRNAEPRDMFEQPLQCAIPHDQTKLKRRRPQPSFGPCCRMNSIVWLNSEEANPEESATFLSPPILTLVAVMRLKPICI